MKSIPEAPDTLQEVSVSVNEALAFLLDVWDHDESFASRLQIAMRT